MGKDEGQECRGHVLLILNGTNGLSRDAGESGELSLGEAVLRAGNSQTVPQFRRVQEASFLLPCVSVNAGIMPSMHQKITDTLRAPITTRDTTGQAFHEDRNSNNEATRKSGMEAPVTRRRSPSVERARRYRQNRHPTSRFCS